MSLVHRPKMTEKGLAARRANGRKGQGPATEPGKAQSARSNLRHGFYSQRVDSPIAEFGENPKEYARLLNSLVDDLQPRPGLQSELILRMRRTLWRMRRAERIRDGAALRRVQAGLRMQDLSLAPRLIQTHGFYERLIALWNELKRADYCPASEEIESLAKYCGDTSSEEVQEFFSLLRAFREAALRAPESASPCAEGEAAAPTAEGQAWQAAHHGLVAALDRLIHYYRPVLDMVLAESENIRSPENIAALIGGRDDDTLVMQKISDSNLRELWRITKLFVMLKRNLPENEKRSSAEFVGRLRFR